MSLEKAYLDIKTKFGDILEIEPFCIVKSVDDHRNFWKPEKVRILLLAESHVYTPMTEYNHVMRYDRFPELNGCPKNYVKLVYCLGYGERNFSGVNSKSGTPPFWKIFVSCTQENFNSEFKKILLGKTKNQNQRLRNKICLLESLKEKGIWLLDASIVAINDTFKPSPKIKKEILKISWEQYISKVIKEIQPEKIMVVGKGVSNDLEEELKKTRIDIGEQPQPNSYLSTEKRVKIFEKYYKFCNI